MGTWSITGKVSVQKNFKIEVISVLVALYSFIIRGDSLDFTLSIKHSNATSKRTFCLV